MKKPTPQPLSRPRIKLSPTRILFLILGANLVLSLLLFDPRLATAGDNFTYLNLAESFLKYGTFRDLQRPGEPASALENAGFPLLLAGLKATFGGSIVLMKLFMLLLILPILVFVYHQLRPKENLLLPVLIAGTLALAPDLFDSSRDFFTEVPFVALVFGSICFAESAVRSERLSHLLIGIALVAGTCYVRTHGFLLVAGIGLWLLIRKDWRRLGIFAVAIILLLLPFLLRAWQLSATHAQASSIDRIGTFMLKDPYSADSGRIGPLDMVVRMVQNARIYFLELLPPVFFPSFYSVFGRSSLLATIVALGIVALVIYGFTRSYPKLTPLSIVFLAGYLFSLLIWPSVWSSPRFLLPLYPLLLLFFFAPYVIPKLRVFPLAVLSGLVFISHLLVLVPKVSGNLAMLTEYSEGDRYAGYSDDWRNYFQATEWLKTNTPPGAVVLARKPEIAYYVSKRKALLYPLTSEAEKVLQFIHENNIAYVIVDGFYWTGSTPRYLIPALNLKPELFRTVYNLSAPPTHVLEVERQ